MYTISVSKLPVFRGIMTYDLASPFSFCFIGAAPIITLTTECHSNFCCLIVTIRRTFAIEMDDWVIALQESPGFLYGWKSQETESS